MKKVLLIQPPIRTSGDHIDYPYFCDLPLFYLANAVRQNGHQVHLLDAFALENSASIRCSATDMLYGRPHAALFERLADADFDVAVVHLTPFDLAAKHTFGLDWLFETLRQLRPSSVIIGAELYVGGMHRVDSDQSGLLLKWPALDYFVPFEGEDQILTLLDGLPLPPPAANRPTEGWERWCVPDWSLIDRGSHMGFLASIGGTARTHLYPVNANTLPIQFSRGCPYKCSFCSNPFPSFRPLSADDAFRVIQAAKGAGADNLFVLDDAANLNPHFLQILTLCQESGLRLTFPNGLRSDALTPAQVEALARVCDHITVSAESGSTEVLRSLLNKSIRPHHIERTAQLCKSSNLPLSVHYMVGIPGESRADVEATLCLARRLLDEYAANPLIQYATPLPGTRLAATGESGNLTNDSTTQAFGHKMQHSPTWVPDEVTSDELEKAVSLLRKRTDASRTAKVIINLTYRCNNHCEFCAVGNRLQHDLPLDTALRILDDHRARGISLLDLDGGEPTLHPDLFAIVAHAATLNYRPITVTTNGRRLAYLPFARGLVQSGIHNLLVSIHGPTAPTHEAVTKAPGSFAETLAGIRNVSSLRSTAVELGINTTVSKSNYKHLRELMILLSSYAVRKINLQFLTPFGRAGHDVLPPPTEAAAEVRTVVSEFSSRFTFQIVNAPFCLLPGLEDIVGQDLGKLARNMVFVTDEEVNLYEYLAQSRKRIPDCKSCLYSVICDGIYDFSEVRS